MFNNIVGVTCLNDEMASMFFDDKVALGGIASFRGQYDHSFLATCRALLTKRLGDNRRLYVASSNYQGRYNTPDGVNDIITALEENIKGLKDRAETRGDTRAQSYFELIIVDKGVVQLYEEKFKEKEGWREVEKARQFFAKNFPCCVWVNDEQEASFFVIETPRSLDATLRCYHVAQCVILTANPWLFDAEKDRESVMGMDIEFLNCIKEGDYQKYLDYLRKYADFYDFREAAILKVLEDFEYAQERGREERLVGTISDFDYEINDMMERITVKVRKKREMQLQLQAIRIGIAEKEGRHVIRDYFKEHDNIHFITRRGDDEIEFTIDTYLCDWDNAALENAIHKRRSVMFDYLNNDEERNDAELLYTSIFEKNEIKVPMTATFRMSYDGRIYAMDHGENNIALDHMPNPHIYFYHCLGGYEADIMNAMREDKIEYALEIATVSAGNVNFEDNTVMQKWTDWMFHRNCDNRKCFELPDGNRVTIKEAIKWLKEKEVENEQSN